MSPNASRHELLTVIEAIAPVAGAKQTTLIKTDGGGIEIRQPESVARVFLEPNEIAGPATCGFPTDGRLFFVVLRKGCPFVAGAFDATWLKGPEVDIRGKGLVRWTKYSANGVEDDRKRPR